MNAWIIPPVRFPHEPGDDSVLTHENSRYNSFTSPSKTVHTLCVKCGYTEYVSKGAANPILTQPTDLFLFLFSPFFVKWTESRPIRFPQRIGRLSFDGLLFWWYNSFTSALKSVHTLPAPPRYNKTINKGIAHPGWYSRKFLFCISPFYSTTWKDSCPFPPTVQESFLFYEKACIL